MSAKWKLVIAWLISIIALDQLTKIIVDRSMALHRDAEQKADLRVEQILIGRGSDGLELAAARR